MKCIKCKKEYKSQDDFPCESNVCIKCNNIAWKKWEIKEADNLKKIDQLQNEGHSFHCACRQVWGDGVCICNKGITNDN